MMMTTIEDYVNKVDFTNVNSPKEIIKGSSLL